MKRNPRRDFLKKTFLGVSGTAILSSTKKASGLHTGYNSVSESIPARTLGKTGVKMPLISMGTGDTNNPALIKAAYDKGVKLFGTSTYYGNGNNEILVGKVFRDLPRDSYWVATSTMPRGTDEQKGLYLDPSAAPVFQKDIESSMKRMGVDFLDILFLPFAAKRESVFFEPLLRVMEDFRKKGKARFIGIATHSYVDEALRAAADSGIYDVAMAAYNFRSERLPAVSEAVSYAARAGLGIIAMKSMAGGYWDENRTQPINSAAALKWILQNESVHTVMSGMTTFDELLKNLAMAGDLRFSDDELNDLRQTSNETPGTGLYCLQCGDCRDMCPNVMNIPTLMRSYMYAYGYRNPALARFTLDTVDLSGKSCSDCDTCSVTCKAGFNVKKKICDIARLKNVPAEFLMV